MINKSLTHRTKHYLGILFAALLMFCSSAAAQTEPPPVAGETKAELPAVTTPAAESVPPSAPAAARPLVNELLGVSLGMTVDQVREKLGKPDTSDKSGMVFTPDGQSVQIGLDEKQTVRSVAVMYMDVSKAPAVTEVIGEAAVAEGDVYELKRYPEAGYWVSYSKTNSASSPLIVVMMRRL